MNPRLQLVAALAVLASAATAQFNDPGIVPTHDGGHMIMSDLAAAGHAVGFSTPPVGGSEGHTTVGGFPAYTYVSGITADVNAAGLCSNEPPLTIAFDTGVWGPGVLGPPIDWTAVVAFAAVAYHESLHAVYQVFFEAWANANPLLWQQFLQCLQNQGHGWGPTNSPCGQAYAADGSFDNLCADKMAICDADWLAPSVQEALLAGFDLWMKGQHDQ